MISLPITTARLTIRMMREGHVAALVEYRNDPEVARHQEWALPFTAEMGGALVAGQAAYDGPVNEEFVQLAIERDGEIVGDLAVQLHDEGRQALLGYSIRRDRQGNGYATEASAAMVDALFAAGLHRVVASIDPANTASRRVLEKLGFRHEGRSLSSAFVRGQWADDDRFALLASEHAVRTSPA